MCCFSGKVSDVSHTQIFARGSENGRQFVVYSMRVKAEQPVAMILPIPVALRSGEQAVRFIDLSRYPGFFDDLYKGMLVGTRGGRGGVTQGLEVVQVGSYDASFVPTVRDFRRLDPRFRLPKETWKALPQYAQYGFAVFKLREGEHKYHPMAFEFPRAVPRRLFFPTVHIHDGEVHKTAEFDHLLFCQRSAGEVLPLTQWGESAGWARGFAQVEKSQGILAPDGHVYMQRMRGSLPNQDTWLG